MIEKMFPGVHSDVGGGYSDSFDIQYGPLMWMWKQGNDCGVPWFMPADLAGWTPPTGPLAGHQSNIPPIRFWLGIIPVGMTAHPQAQWNPIGQNDPLGDRDWWYQ